MCSWTTFSSVQSLRRVRLLQPHESQDARPPCPSPTPGYPNLRTTCWTHKPNTLYVNYRVFLGGSVVNNLPATTRDTGDVGSISGSGRSPGQGNSNSFQYSCLGNAMDRKAWGGYSIGSRKIIRHDWVTQGARTRAHTHTHTHTIQLSSNNNNKNWRFGGWYHLKVLSLSSVNLSWFQYFSNFSTHLCLHLCS